MTDPLNDNWRWTKIWSAIPNELLFSPNSWLQSFQFNRVKRSRGTAWYCVVAKHRNLRRASCIAITWEPLFSIALAPQYEYSLCSSNHVKLCTTLSSWRKREKEILRYAKFTNDMWCCERALITPASEPNCVFAEPVALLYNRQDKFSISSDSDLI